MKYALNLTEKFDLTAPSASGAIVGQEQRFVAWQPSTWPAAPLAVDEKFIYVLKGIFEDSMLTEISSTIGDIHKCHGSLTGRGHVIAIAEMCALDAIASYGYRNHHVSDFINAHFRPDYRPFANAIYKLHRNSLIHSWNLFEASIYPDDTKIKSEGGTVAFGLLDFFTVLVDATQDFLNQLEASPDLQRNSLARYAELKATAKA